MGSTAISTSIESRAVGYQILNRTFDVRTSNLPMRIALLGEPNTANEATLDVAPFSPLNAQEIGAKYGYGSPLYQMGRILLPIFGGGLGSIPLVVYPQSYAVGATATAIVLGIAVGTTVTKTVTHSLKINGRDNIDGIRFDYTVTSGENTAAVVAKIADCINNVLTAPCTAVGGTGIVTATSKWKGLTSAPLSIEFVTYGDSAGITYSETSRTDGTGTPSIAAAITAFGNEWNTIVINPYGTATLTDLETANGTPSSVTGKYTTTIFKPFVALFGSVEDDKDDLVAITNASARQDQVTNVLCPAPLSKGLAFEAAANMAVLCGTIANETPHLGVGGKSYPDMPIPSDGVIGDMADLSGRNLCMKKGCSTVLLENGKYTVQDFVTTYAPTGEVKPKFRYVRDLIVDWNIGYAVKLINISEVQDKAIIADTSATKVENTISPSSVKSLLIGCFKDLESRALLVDSQFSKDSLSVVINSTNAARIDESFKYKRSSVANQVATDAAVDFNYNV